MTLRDLPTLNAILNATTAVLLITGRMQIKRGRVSVHKKIMISALVVSCLFLTSYLFYHYNVGTVRYPHHNWTRPLYLIILGTHTVLAAGMVPFIIAAVTFALKEKFEKHRRLVRWVWPIWIYISVTGIVVYLMLYRL